jgi:putative FmdB family regulatory protein
MPIYEYKCERCNEVFEVRQKFADEPVTVHENCGGAVRRLMSAPALQFKGTGWYITDYGRAGSGKGGEAKSESKDSSSESKESKSESKESKSDSKTDSNGSKSGGSESKSSTPPASAKSESKSDSSTK